MAVFELQTGAYRAMGAELQVPGYTGRKPQFQLEQYCWDRGRRSYLLRGQSIQGRK